MRVQYPKYAYGPYCLLNPIYNGVYILVEVSFYISSLIHTRALWSGSCCFWLSWHCKQNLKKKHYYKIYIYMSCVVITSIYSSLDIRMTSDARQIMNIIYLLFGDAIF